MAHPIAVRRIVLPRENFFFAGEAGCSISSFGLLVSNLSREVVSTISSLPRILSSSFSAALSIYIGVVGIFDVIDCVFIAATSHSFLLHNNNTTFYHNIHISFVNMMLQLILKNTGFQVDIMPGETGSGKNDPIKGNITSD
jgi:hypothetical protein